MFVAILLLCTLLSDSISGLILPMTKPDGSTDFTSILSHVTLLEQTFANLQKDVQANKVQAAEVASLKTEVRLLSNELAVVKAELNDIKQGNGNSKIPTSAGPQITQRNLSQLTAELQSTKALAQNTSKQLEILKMDMNSTSADLQVTQRNLSIIGTEVTTLGSDLHVVENQSLDNKQLLAMLASKTRTVVFQAEVPLPFPTGVNETVKYNYTSYNAGSGYNSSTGTFTAPVSGTYLFYLQIKVSWQKAYMFVFMKKSGGVFKSAGYQEAGDSDVVVRHLDKGEEVGVITEQPRYYYDLPAQIFVGILLAAD